MPSDKDFCTNRHVPQTVIKVFPRITDMQLKSAAGTVGLEFKPQSCEAPASS